MIRVLHTVFTVNLLHVFVSCHSVTITTTSPAAAAAEVETPVIQRQQINDVEHSCHTVKVII